MRRKPNTFGIEELNVALHAQSVPARDITADLATGHPGPVAGAFNIGVLHKALGGLPGHANYAPCTLEVLQAKGYQYRAFGHIHHGRILNERPHVVFPGGLQGRSIKETGPKDANLVTVEDGEVTEFSTFHCDVVRWARLQVDVADCERDTVVVGSDARGYRARRSGYPTRNAGRRQRQWVVRRPDLQTWLAEEWQDEELVQRIGHEMAEFCSKLPSEA